MVVIPESNVVKRPVVKMRVPTACSTNLFSRASESAVTVGWFKSSSTNLKTCFRDCGLFGPGPEFRVAATRFALIGPVKPICGRGLCVGGGGRRVFPHPTPTPRVRMIYSKLQAPNARQCGTERFSRRLLAQYRVQLRHPRWRGVRSEEAQGACICAQEGRRVWAGRSGGGAANMNMPNSMTLCAGGCPQHPPRSTHEPRLRDSLGRD